MRFVLPGLAALALLSACDSSSNRDETADTTDAGPQDGGTANNEPEAMKGMTAAHNDVRQSVSPRPEMPIPALTWSTSIASVAQAYAEHCEFKHSGGQYGENIYASTNASTPQEVVSSWASEAADYDYASNTCSNVCGHYTQVVWADTKHLGCGMTECTSNSPFGSGNWFFWVCNYDPPGNYVGQKPY